MRIDLEDLYLKQADLDKNIAEAHQVSYENTNIRRFLALLVEFGEMANETRCFKYWSNKPRSEKTVILEEYADCLHFILSLGIPLNVSKFVYEFDPSSTDLSEQIVNLYRLSLKMHDDYSKENYYEALKAFLIVGASIGFSSDDIKDGYYKKLDVNYNRQKTNY